MEKNRILLVEDEVALADAVQMRLEASGYDVLIARDGQEGLSMAQTEKPDLILLDVMLPEMDGYKVCGLLKRDPRYADIPIIFLTARAQEDDKKLGGEMGADAYIIKPYEPQVLLSKIKELLEKAEGE